MGCALYEVLHAQHAFVFVMDAPRKELWATFGAPGMAEPLMARCVRVCLCACARVCVCARARVRACVQGMGIGVCTPLQLVLHSYVTTDRSTRHPLNYVLLCVRRLL